MRTYVVVLRALLCLSLPFTLTTVAGAQTFSTNIVSSSGVSFAPADAVTTPTPLTTPAITFAPATQPVPANAGPHTFAVGVRAGGYAAGIGFMVRYWFTNHLFLDADISHYGQDFGGFGYASFGQTVTSFSVLYNFYNEGFDALRLRIYAGGGVNVAHTSYSFVGNVNAANAGLTNWGGQGVGGVELIFKPQKIRRLGVGAELVASTTHVFQFVDPVGGFGSTIYAVWYLK